MLFDLTKTCISAIYVAVSAVLYLGLGIIIYDEYAASNIYAIHDIE